MQAPWSAVVASVCLVSGGRALAGDGDPCEARVDLDRVLVGTLQGDPFLERAETYASLSELMAAPACWQVARPEDLGRLHTYAIQLALHLGRREEAERHALRWRAMTLPGPRELREYAELGILDGGPVLAFLDDVAIPRGQARIELRTAAFVDGRPGPAGSRFTIPAGEHLVQELGATGLVGSWRALESGEVSSVGAPIDDTAATRGGRPAAIGLAVGGGILTAGGATALALRPLLSRGYEDLSLDRQVAVYRRDQALLASGIAGTTAGVTSLIVGLVLNGR